jgi:hypothetical protein
VRSESPYKAKKMGLIQNRGHAIEGDLDAIIFNPIASDIPKLRISASEMNAIFASASVGP